QLPGKTFSKKNFEALIESLGQQDITTQIWQVDYDLVWSIKPDGADHARSTDALNSLRCPVCQTKFQSSDRTLVCAHQHRFPVANDDVIELLKGV
ncbi:MAG TPA: hypothetical protein VFK30_07835, partial [Anaerolineae bacterium]|nr:hypothetical protein [Anaerolineae bacterium]